MRDVFVRVVVYFQQQMHDISPLIDGRFHQWGETIDVRVSNVGTVLKQKLHCVVMVVGGSNVQWCGVLCFFNSFQDVGFGARTRDIVFEHGDFQQGL
jgi:hypothetical protein